MNCNRLLMILLAIAALACLALPLAGCNHSQSAYAAAPPAGPNAHPAALLAPGRNHLLRGVSLYKPTKQNSGPAGARR